MKNKINILLTGASGFLGQRYTEYNENKYNLSSISLQKTLVDDIIFENVDVVVHMAGIAHQMQKIDDKIYFDVNYDLTKSFAEKAKKEGVKHFIFVSTIKAFGEYHQKILTLETKCEPINDPYGQSKLDAEIDLQKMETDKFIVSIVRPPLIYGPKVKGNLIRFLKLADTPFPLPFKGINNRRTMVFIDNLIELMNIIVEKRHSGVFLAGDAKPISTTFLIQTMRNQMKKKPNLFKIPNLVKTLLTKFKPELAIRLYGSLEMDTSKTNAELNFKPPYSIEEGINTMVQWYLKNK